METMEETTTEQVEAADPVSAEPAAKVSARSMFKYSEYLDIGEGAEECEHSRDGQCDNMEHFHAWCRLPNPYQHQDIRSKALAAKARKLRELRDPESDASVIIDEELAAIDDPIFVETLIDELLMHEWAQDYLEARRLIEEREEFEHIAQDREEYERLHEAEGDLEPEEQTEEYKRLVQHVADYLQAVREGVDETQKPKKDELRERPVEQLVKLVRAKRVEDDADSTFIETYQAWMWFVGTFKPEPHPTLRRPHIAMWEQIGRKDRAAAGTMYGEAPEVIAALKQTFNTLELALQKGSAGN